MIIYPGSDPAIIEPDNQKYESRNGDRKKYMDPFLQARQEFLEIVIFLFVHLI
jgi:hypothetical protein